MNTDPGKESCPSFFCFSHFQLAEEISRKEQEREEMERIRMELHLEEQEEKERQKERVSAVSFRFSKLKSYILRKVGPLQ